MIPVGILSSIGVPAFTYLSDVNNAQLASGVNTHTVNGRSIGTASTDRIVIVSTSFASGVFTQSSQVTGVTCNGNAMTPIRTPSSRVADTNLWYLVVPSGTTADFIVTLESVSGDKRAGVIGFGNIKNVSSSTPTIIDGNASANESYTLLSGDTVVAAQTARVPGGGYIFNTSGVDITVHTNDATALFDSTETVGVFSSGSNMTAGSTQLISASMGVASHSSFVYAIWR